MKKRLLIVACCLIIGALGMIMTGCGGDADKYADSPYVGMWKGTTAEYSGIEMNVEEILGTFDITFNADGTCEATVGEETESGDWEPTDTGLLMKDSTDELAFTDQDGKLVVEYEGVNIFFEKQ